MCAPAEARLHMMAVQPGREIDRAPSALAEDVVCETCGPARMILTREPRSPVLRVVGFTLWVDALLTLTLGVSSGALFVSAGSGITDEVMRGHRTDAAAALVQVTSIPRATIDAFERTGAFDDTVLIRLSPGERSRTDRILELYRAHVESDAASGARRSIGIPIACLFLFGAGLFLTLKRDVWRCATCGHARRVARRRSAWFPSAMSPTD